jgi:hypothetical protein
MDLRNTSRNCGGGECLYMIRFMRCIENQASF